MIAMYAPTPLPSSNAAYNLQDTTPVTEVQVETLHDALQPFIQSILSSGNETIRLHCSLPTCCPSEASDLYDLHDFRGRLLQFIHEVLHSVRKSGMSASYCLAPSGSPSCVVRAIPSASSTSFFDGQVSKKTLAKGTAEPGCPTLVIS